MSIDPRDIEEAQTCASCPLAEKPYVLGDGDPKAPIMVVGTAPGAMEEFAGRAFTGDVGQLVKEVFEGMLGDRIWFTNVVKRRPTNSKGQQREPNQHECWKCGSHFVRELMRVGPRLVVSMGHTPTTFMMGNAKAQLERVHGLPIEVHRFGQSFILFPTYDPAYVLRKGGLTSAAGEDWIGDIEEAQIIARREGILD